MNPPLALRILLGFCALSCCVLGVPLDSAPGVDSPAKSPFRLAEALKPSFTRGLIFPVGKQPTVARETAELGEILARTVNTQQSGLNPSRERLRQ